MPQPTGAMTSSLLFFPVELKHSILYHYTALGVWEHLILCMFGGVDGPRFSGSRGSTIPYLLRGVTDEGQQSKLDLSASG
jgi:hypothetical protein